MSKPTFGSGPRPKLEALSILVLAVFLFGVAQVLDWDRRDVVLGLGAYVLAIAIKYAWWHFKTPKPTA